MRKSAGSKWGVTPNTVRTTGLAFCFYADNVQYGTNQNTPTHVDTAPNECRKCTTKCRAITGCLKPTPLKYICVLAGIAPPRMRRRVVISIERTK